MQTVTETTGRRGPIPLNHRSPTVRANFTMPESMRSAFKALCERRGIDMSAEIRAMITRELERGK